ncbi:MAG: protein kinase [Verrucomicrobiota bacterium]
MSNRYEIKEKIGQGGVGAVFKAFDTQLKRDVALKRLTPDVTEGEVKSDDVLKEATTLSALQHPNIVTVFDVGTDEEGPFVVMELLDGETFDDTIKRGALTEADFRAVVSQTLEGVIAAHDREMVHRDLKPSNLMVSWLPSGKFQIKILDFGLAKFGKQPSKQTTDHEDGILGSIFFMAPEQFERVELDVRTDLYALGCIYYYGLTTKYPFHGDTPAQVMASHLRHQIRDIKPMRPDLPEWMCRWVMWLVSRDIADRPESAVQALEYFNREEVFEKIETVEAASGVKMITGPVTAKAGTGPVATAAPAGAAVAGVAQVAGGPTGKTAPTAFAGPPKTKGLGGLPKWAWFTLPVLMVALGIVFFVKKKGVEEQIELNQQILALTEEEEPQGNPETVEMLLDFVRVGMKTGASQLDENNARAVLSTLGRMEGEGVDDALIRALKSTTGAARAGVIGVLNERELERAINQVAPFLGDDYTEAERAAAVTFFGWRGGTQELTDLIGALKTTESEKMRQTFEKSIVNLALQFDDADRRTTRVLNSLKNATGPYRHSLLKILAQLGGEQAWKTMKFSVNSNDEEERSVALKAMSEWPDHHALQDMFEMAKTEKEVVDRELAGRAVVEMLKRPNSLSGSQKIEMITAIYQNTGSNRTKRDLISAASEIYDPKTVNFLKKEGENPGSVGAMAKAVAQRIEDALDKVLPVGESTNLQAKDAFIEGSGKIGFDKKANAVLGWDMEATRVRFPVKFQQPGTYKVTVVQALKYSGGSDYYITVGDQTIEAKTEKTGGPDKFKPVPVGEVSIENAGIFMLDIIPFRVSDYELMNFRALRLERTGDVEEEEA